MTSTVDPGGQHRYPAAAHQPPPQRSLAEAAERLHQLLQAPEGPGSERALGEARALAEDLHRALPARFVIERAKGVVMGRLDCDPDQAFVHLRALSQRRNLPLRKIAEEVATTGRLDPAP